VQILFHAFWQHFHLLIDVKDKCPATTIIVHGSYQALTEPNKVYQLGFSSWQINILLKYVTVLNIKSFAIANKTDL